jgi:cupin 2 domain-containing protein
MKTGSMFDDVPAKLDAEQVTDLVREGGVCIKRIVSTGHATGWLDPDDEEWVIVLKGAAVLRFEEGNRKLTMRPGDWCYISTGCRHRVEETSDKEPTVWIAVHFKASETVASDGEAKT